MAKCEVANSFLPEFLSLLPEGMIVTKTERWTSDSCVLWLEGPEVPATEFAKAMASQTLDGENVATKVWLEKIDA